MTPDDLRRIDEAAADPSRLRRTVESRAAYRSCGTKGAVVCEITF